MSHERCPHTQFPMACGTDVFSQHRRSQVYISCVVCALVITRTLFLFFFLFCSSPVVLPPPRSLCSVPCVFQSCVYLFIHLDRLRYRRANHQTKCDGEISVNLWSRVQCACRAVRALICRPPNQSNDLTHFTAPICIPSSITIIITYA